MSLPQAHTRYLERSYLPALDGLRALSIVGVMWHHCWTAPPPGIWGKGPAGVQLFFAISGYLVTTLLLRERERSGQVSLPAFFARRALRIFPLYYAVLGVLAAHALFAAPSPQREHFFRNLPYFSTFTCNWWVDWNVSHPITFAFAWTLAVEEQFYAFWAPVLRWLRGLLGPTLVMSTVLALSQASLTPLGRTLLGEGLLRTVCDGLSSSIALGSLLAIALHHPRSGEPLLRSLQVPGARTVTLAAVCLCLAFDVHHLLFHTALVLLVGACVAAPDRRGARVLSLPWMVWIGRRSYGLYLTHFAAIGAVRALVGDAPLAVFAISMPLALVLAGFVFEWLERPFLLLKRRFAIAPAVA